MWPFIAASPSGYTMHSRNNPWEGGSAWENDVKLEALNPHQAFVLLKNAFAIPKLKYVLRASPAYLCREEWLVFDRALFDSLERVAIVSSEGDVCEQAGFIVSLGDLGCRRAGDFALPSFIASMNSVCQLVETILSRIINIADTNELAEVVEFCRGASGGASMPDDPRHRKAWGPSYC